MSDGIHNPNNPAKVPPILAAIDQPQEGLPRIIHPIGMLVGRPDPDAAASGVINMSEQYAAPIVLKEDVTLTNREGRSFRYRKGYRMTAAHAVNYPDLQTQLEGKPVDGAADARSVIPEADLSFTPPENRGLSVQPEQPDIAPTEAQLSATRQARGAVPSTITDPAASVVADKPATIAEMRAQAEAEGIDIPSVVTRHADIAAYLQGERAKRAGTPDAGAGSGSEGSAEDSPPGGELARGNQDADTSPTENGGE